MSDNKLIMMKATAVKSTYRHTGKVEFQQWLNFIGGLIATSAVSVLKCCWVRYWTPPEKWDVQLNNCGLEVRQYSLWSLSSSFVREAVPLPSHSALVRRSSAWLHIRYLQKHDNTLCQMWANLVHTSMNVPCAAVTADSGSISWHTTAIATAIVSLLRTHPTGLSVTNAWRAYS